VVEGLQIEVLFESELDAEDFVLQDDFVMVILDMDGFKSDVEVESFSP